MIFEHRYEPGLPLYMGITRDGCTLHPSEHHGDGCPGARLRIQISDVVAFHQEISAKNYKYESTYPIRSATSLRFPMPLDE